MTEEYTATEWDTAEYKAKWEKQLIRFVERGAQREHFTPKLYKRLSLMFGHIAHYNIDGFYGEWFGTPKRKVKWLRWIQNGGRFGGVGDPSVTWSDVEISLQTWAIENDEQLMDALTGSSAQERDFAAKKDEYITVKGIACLDCGEQTVRWYTDIKRELHGICWQLVDCYTCGCSWIDIFTLTDVQDFEKGLQVDIKND